LFKPALIGRTSDCDIILDDSSVSRRHARIDLENGQFSIQDLDSFNGVLLNGEKVPQAPFGVSDEIRIGRFTIVVLDESERYYKGRAISYMVEHSEMTADGNQATRNISEEEVTLLGEKRRIINGGRVRSRDNPDNYWFPEDRKLTLGSDAMVAVTGLLMPALAAEVTWDGSAHVVRQLSWRVGVRVNGKKIDESTLKDGDEFTVGSSSFVYNVKV